MLRRINRGVPGYDVDKQYAILVNTIEIERIVAAETGRDGFWAIFKGVDGVSSPTGLPSERWIVQRAEPNVLLPASWYSVPDIPHFHSAWSPGNARP
jgi:hypothetical protein